MTYPHEFHVNTVMSRRQLLRLAAVPASIALTPATALAAAQSIASERFVSIGGIEQWVAIRGRDRTRTPLLFLHGGPGEAQSAFLPIFAPWEDRFVVAHWDQRGSGRTFGKNGTATPDMTLEQMTRDVVEVAAYVLGQLNARKLVLVGHSWGTILGLGAIRLRPELFHAFVGTGQVVSGREIIERMRSSAIAQAQATGDAESVAALRAVNLRDPDLSDMRELGILFKWAPRFPPVDSAFLMSRGALLGSPANPASVAAADFFASNPDPRSPASRPFSLLRLWRYVYGFEALAAGYDLRIPFFVVQGREDTRTPPEAAHAFLSQVRAPAKRYTAIEGGHFACFSNPTEFLDALGSNIGRLGIG
jgi:pimeloyl-ACP methyl ester carboxylesterase